MTDTTTDPTVSTSDPTEPEQPTEPAPTEPPASDPAVPETPSPEAKVRRPKGHLESDVKRICDDFVVGKIVLGEDELLTPHKISRLIKEQEGLAEAPSTGAVAACLDRWAAIGFALLNEKPVAFSDYTDAGRTDGLSALKAKAAEQKRAARKAEKDASKGAAEATSDAAAGSADGSIPGAGSEG